MILTLERGGAESALTRLLLEMPAAFRRRSEVVTLLREGPYAAQLRASGVRVVCLEGRQGPYHWASVGLRLRSYLAATEPAVVHSWMYHANLASAITTATLPRRPRLFWGVRHAGDVDLPRATKSINRLCAKVAGLPHGIVYPSPAARRVHVELGYPDRKSLVIPNGFDTDRFRPDEGRRARIRHELGITNKDLVVGHVGRWHPSKGHSLMLDAICQSGLAAPDRRLVLLMAGQGVDTRNVELMRRCEALRVANIGVRLLGERSDLEAIYNALDLFCSSSLTEGFPNVLGEAMSSAVPCVASDVGGSGFVLGDRGVLVGPNATELSAGLSRMLHMRSAARRVLGIRARERILNQFSLARAVTKYAELWAA